MAVSMRTPLALYREQVRCTSFRGASALDPVTGTGSGGTQFPDDTNEAADVVVARTEQHERLVKALATLPGRLQKVLRLYYEEDYSLREIGIELGVTESRVCQLHREAINALRLVCVSDDAEDAEAGFAPASGWV